MEALNQGIERHVTLHTFSYEYWFDTAQGESHHAILQFSTTWGGHVAFRNEANELVAGRIRDLHEAMGNRVIVIRRLEQNAVEVEAPTSAHESETKRLLAAIAKGDYIYPREQHLTDWSDTTTGAGDAEVF
jgi:hypothetical protein